MFQLRSLALSFGGIHPNGQINKKAGVTPRAAGTAAEINILHPRWLLWGNLHKCGWAIPRTWPPCTLGIGRTRNLFWFGRSYPPYTVKLFARTDICAGCAKRNASIKNCTASPPPEVSTTITGPLKLAWGEWQGCLQPSDGRPFCFDITSAHAQRDSEYIPWGKHGDANKEIHSKFNQ